MFVSVFVLLRADFSKELAPRGASWGTERGWCGGIIHLTSGSVSVLPGLCLQAGVGTAPRTVTAPRPQVQTAAEPGQSPQPASCPPAPWGRVGPLARLKHDPPRGVPSSRSQDVASCDGQAGGGQVAEQGSRPTPTVPRDSLSDLGPALEVGGITGCAEGT